MTDITAGRLGAHWLGDASDASMTAVLVHGLGDDWRTWEPLAERLTGCRKVALEMPWQWGSGYAWRRAAPPGDWLAEGLAALDVPAVVLIGHSFGANAVLQLMSKNGLPRILAAVLVAPTYLPPDVPVTWRMFDISRAAFERELGRGIRMRLRAHMTGSRAENIEAFAARTMDRIGPNGFLAVFDQFTSSGHLPLERVDTPTLILAGQRDSGILRWQIEALADRLRRGTLCYEPEHDHFAHVRKAPEMAQKIYEFVAAALADAVNTGEEAQ